MTAGPRSEDERPTLLVVKGGATTEEVAALVAVLQAVAGAAPPPVPRKPRSEWAAPHRKVRPGYLFGLVPGRAAWRSSSLPR